jgi:predicted dehydrogenase
MNDMPDTNVPAEITRRRFLGRTAAGVVAGFSAIPSPAPASVGAAGDRLRIGVIGVRRRGLELALALAARPDVEVAALCDVDAYIRRCALRDLSAVQSRVPLVVADARRLFDDPALHAVVIATPDHSHAPLTVAACEAGKDVYLEAPVSHTRDDESSLLKAAAGRIVQCGLQQRSGTHFQSAVELVRSGGIGRVGAVRVWAVHRRGQSSADGTDGDAKRPAPSPFDVDYTRWLGDAPAVDFDPLRFHHSWRWFWDYGSGELGNLGVHLLDVARWGLGVDLPQRVTAQGLRLRDDSPGETPDTLTVQYEYPQATLTWEHRLWTGYGVEGRSAGVAFHGTDGTLVVDRGGWKVYGRKDGPSAPSSPLLEPHLADFIDCVRTRRTPVADLQTGLTSSALCHLGNAAYRTGREVRLG